MLQQILKLPVVKSLTGLSRSTIYRYASRGVFPKPIHLGERSVGWLEDEVNQWIEQRITATRGENKE